MKHKGFGSIYLILVLTYVTAFAGMLLTQSMLHRKVVKDDDALHYAYIFALYQIKSEMHACDIQEEQECVFDEKQEMHHWQGHTILLQYQKQQVHVQIDMHTMDIFCDPFLQEIVEIE